MFQLVALLKSQLYQYVWAIFSAYWSIFQWSIGFSHFVLKTSCFYIICCCPSIYLGIWSYFMWLGRSLCFSSISGMCFCSRNESLLQLWSGLSTEPPHPTPSFFTPKDPPTSRKSSFKKEFGRLLEEGGKSCCTGGAPPSQHRSQPYCSQNPLKKYVGNSRNMSANHSFLKKLII